MKWTLLFMSMKSVEKVEDRLRRFVGMKVGFKAGSSELKYGLESMS